jgi:hypothetical protein
MANRFKRHFTVEEARAELPRLRLLFGQIHSARAQMLAAERALGRQLEAGGDIGGETVVALIGALSDIYQTVGRISRRGILIKDIDRGLVDFPHWRHGEEVFLCWELEEDDIEFWHGLDAGYAGRERL